MLWQMNDDKEWEIQNFSRKEKTESKQKLVFLRISTTKTYKYSQLNIKIAVFRKPEWAEWEAE